MSLKKQVMGGLAWTAGGRFAGQVFTWAITIFVVRLLNPADYGLLAMAVIFTSFCGLFSELGMTPALIQAGADVSDVQLQRVFGTVLLVNGGFFLLLVLASPGI